MSNYEIMAPNLTLLSGLGRHCGIDISTNENVDPTFLFDFYAHCRPILHRFATIHNGIVRAIGIGRGCYKLLEFSADLASNDVAMFQVSDCIDLFSGDIQ